MIYGLLSVGIIVVIVLLGGLVWYGSRSVRIHEEIELRSAKDEFLGRNG